MIIVISASPLQLTPLSLSLFPSNHPSLHSLRVTLQYYRIKAKYIYSILCAAHDLATTVREEKVAAAAVRSDKTSTAPPTAAAAAAAGHLAAGVGSSIGNGQQRAAEGAGCCERCATLCSPTTRSFGECEESLTSLDSLLDIQKWPTPRLRKYLLSLKGVGPKTAACVMLYRMRRHDFAVDTNILRISTRLGWHAPMGIDPDEGADLSFIISLFSMTEFSSYLNHT